MPRKALVPAVHTHYKTQVANGISLTFARVPKEYNYSHNYLLDYAAGEFYTQYFTLSTAQSKHGMTRSDPELLNQIQNPSISTHIIVLRLRRSRELVQNKDKNKE